MPLSVESKKRIVVSSPSMIRALAWMALCYDLNKEIFDGVVNFKYDKGNYIPVVEKESVFFVVMSYTKEDIYKLFEKHEQEWKDIFRQDYDLLTKRQQEIIMKTQQLMKFDIVREVNQR